MPPSPRAVPRRKPRPDSPLAAIRKLTAAWIRKDAAGMAGQLTDDITEIGPAFPRPLVGKKAFLRKYQAYFTSPLIIVEYKILRPRQVPLSSRLVLVHFAYRMRTQNGERSARSCGQESMLVEKRHHGWQVKFIHWHRRGDENGQGWRST